jgi:Tfp pilus assembly protein PilV
MTMRLRGIATRVAGRLRSDAGFGLIELLIAMVVTTIAVMALVAALTSAHVTLVRAGRTSTSAAIASAQMERYRALRYAEIRLSASSVSGADTTYTGDTAYDPDAADRVTAASGCTDALICTASQTVTGADGRSYRLDTYIVYETPTSGRQVKKVTVVVRDGTAVRVRETSAFDEATSS